PQTLPGTGAAVFVTSALARLPVSAPQAVETWSSTLGTIGLREVILRPNAAACDRRENALSAELSERQYREALEDIALATTDLFFDVYAAHVALDNAVTNAAVNDTLYRLNQGRFDVGKIGENDLLQSELALLRASEALERARLD